MRMAQTRGGKRVWRMWSSSTKGCASFFVSDGVLRRIGIKGEAYNHEDPEGIVEEDYRGGHEHGEADESVELERS